jgi:amino acid transporter
MIAALGVEADTLVQTLKANPGYEAMRALFPDPNSITRPMMEGYLAWETAPSLFGLRIIFDLPAVFIVVLITYLIYVGISESKNASNWLVYIKFGIIALVLGIGFFYVDTGNWSPFAPNGIPGVLKGVSAVFFAYIGFDALSTMSEEAKNPQRDLPRAMMYALVICTILYIVISLVLTGVVPYQQLAVGDPMAELINYTDLDPFWRNLIRGVVALGAIIATTSVLLIFQLGQPRILMSMARDGLLPKRFAKIHPRYRTPAFASIVTGFLVGLPVFFMNLAEVTDLTSIGTLFAFVLVCAGILYQQLYAGPDYQPKFKVKYINGRVWMPLLLITSAVIMFTQNGAGVSSFLSFSDPEHSTAWSILRRVPLLLFMIVTVGATVLSVTHKLSLIPTLGLVLCFYLMSEVDPMSWYRFLAWLALGLVVYFSFSQKNSRLGQQSPQ